MYISRRLKLYLESWRTKGEGRFIGTSFWRGIAEHHPIPSWTLQFWVGQRMFCLSRNCFHSA